MQNRQCVMAESADNSVLQRGSTLSSIDLTPWKCHDSDKPPILSQSRVLFRPRARFSQNSLPLNAMHGHVGRPGTCPAMSVKVQPRNFAPNIPIYPGE